MVVQALQDQGVEHIFGYPGGAVLPIYDALFHQEKVQPHPGPPRAGRDPRGRGLCALHRQGRRGAGHLGPRRDQRRHRPHRRADGLDPAGLHHRPGADAPDRHRRLPGVRHGRHHPPLHQAQLPGEARRGPAAHPARGLLRRHDRPARARWSSTSPRTSSSPRAPMRGRTSNQHKTYRPHDQGRHRQDHAPRSS